MDEKELWQKFYEGGKVADYLEYRNCVNTENNAELTESAQNDGTGTCNSGTEYRGIR